MNTPALDIVVIGLSITSSWGNGHATTYRALIRALAKRGHQVLFLERDRPWYARNRDMPQPPFGRTVVYTSLDELFNDYSERVARADLVVVGSYVPDGVAVGRWALDTATGSVMFYDIDTPVTLAKLDRGDFEYITPEQVEQYDLYLTFTGGSTLHVLKDTYGARRVAPLLCSVDPSHYYPDAWPDHWDLGYMGTYSADRQPGLERLLLDPARHWADGRFIVAGPQFPEDIVWPNNVDRWDHLPPSKHRRFYNSQRFTLNVTRAAMVEAGFAPSVRLFEAAACGTPIISDWWVGLDSYFTPGEEILIAGSCEDTLAHLRTLSDEQRRKIGAAARVRVLREHTSDHRARQLERYAAYVAADGVAT